MTKGLLCNDKLRGICSIEAVDTVCTENAALLSFQDATYFTFI